jgi:hypothetical protein
VGQAAHDRGIGGRGVGEVDSDLGPMLPNDRQVQPRSRHSGEAASLARMGGWPPRTLGNGHATRMSPDRGNCRGSGLNDVHRGVGGDGCDRLKPIRAAYGT